MLSETYFNQNQLKRLHMLSQTYLWNISAHYDHAHLCWASSKTSFQCLHLHRAAINTRNEKSPRLVSCWNLDLLLWFLGKKTCIEAPLEDCYIQGMPASVAQLDAPSDWRPGGRRFNPRWGRQHSFVEIDHEIFSTVILSLPLIQEGQLSVSGERMCTILVNRLED